MKKFFFILLAISVLGCSTRKDKFANRFYHTLNTKYNVLFNGKESFKSAKKLLDDEYIDNYWEILPIEPLEYDEPPKISFDNNLSGNNRKSIFDTAEEKATKAVQRHSMLIKGKEKNRQIDDSYLLLGKARYYAGRFSPALEAFNYAIVNYAQADLINETRLWQAKTHIRLKNEVQGIESLKFLLKDHTVKPIIRDRAYTALAMAYYNLDSIPLAINSLKKSIAIQEDKVQFTRNSFIIGQLYRKTHKLDSSNIAFEDLKSRVRTPHKLKVQVNLELAKNVLLANTNPEPTIKKLYKKTKDIENRPYLDKIYYQIAQLELVKDTVQAIKTLNLSIEESEQADFQREKSYQSLGDIFYKKDKFINAAGYYDTIVQIAQNKNTVRIKQMSRKIKHLEKAIIFEKTITETDSILSLVSMNDQERITFFLDHVQKQIEKDSVQTNLVEEKKKDGKKKKVAKKLKKKESNKITGSWYFYNPSTVTFGKKEFMKNWGNRTLEDNWRYNAATQQIVTQQTEESDDTNVITTTTEDGSLTPEKSLVKFDISSHIKAIPKDKNEIEALHFTRDNTYLKLGILYKESLKNHKNAAARLEKLLTFNPDESFVLPAEYHLYQLYKKQNNPKAKTHENYILTNYPDSKYAEVVEDPSKILTLDDEVVRMEIDYELLYCDYEEEKFDIVIKKSNFALANHRNQLILAKYQLLRAFAIGKTKGKKAFVKELEEVRLSYPDTEEAEQADQLINQFKAKS